VKRKYIMRKAKSLLGLNIISQREGKQLGTVRDLIFDEEAHKLVAVLLSDRELFGMIDATVVPWSQVQQIGPHAIMVPSEDAIQKAHTDPLIAASYDQKKKLVGKKITTQQGEDLGVVGDLYLEDSGQVTGFEVSGGIFSDAFSGKRFMEMPVELTVGEDRILVPQGIALELQRQKVQEPGGIAAVYSGAVATVSEKSGDLASKANEAFDATKAKVADSYANLAGASVEKQREFVIGKVASRDVVIPASKATTASPLVTDNLAVENLAIGEGGAIDPATDAVVSGYTPTPAVATDITSTGEVVSGEVLVRNGETITALHADRAIEAGVLAQLVAAAAGSSIRNVYGSATGSVSDSLHPTDTTTVAPTAVTPVDNTSSPGMLDQFETAAIGKPSAREIIAPDGSVIIAPGMIVTQAILDRADVYGKKGEVITAAGLGAASEKAQGAYNSARESAGSLWETIKEKTAELTGSAQEKKAEHDNKVEQGKINNALGRPVTRVILDRSDAIILNTGDLITNSAVNRAREAGVLDILLDSVYAVDPDITPEMLRAQGKGQAALDEQVEPIATPVVTPVVTTPASLQE
jgi:uncharacterized protein YrrD